MSPDAIRALPKAELHVHLEGTVDSNTVLDLAARHDVEPPAATAAAIDKWYRFDGFPMFLDRYFTVLGLLRDPDDFALIAERYLRRSHDDGVVHVEFHVSACGHIVENGRAWAPIHDGIVRGCAAAAAKTGISWGLIPDISPHLPADACRTAIGEVLAHSTEHLVAIGMGGPADTWSTDDFSPIYADAASVGIPGVAHAGEHGGPEEVRFALEHFSPVRIQHGIGAAQDIALLDELADLGIPCDVCPGSNVALAAVPDMASHPLPLMLERGVTVTLGSDDPPMFQTTLLDEYRTAAELCGLDDEGLRTLAENSLRASLAPDVVKNRWG